MTPTMSQILADTRRFTQTKIAEITGKDPSTIPGAEHDSAVPEEMLQPDSEVADPIVAPAASRTTAGAGGSIVPNDESLEADEPVLEPDKKPMITADANTPKTAELANEILGLIRDHQTKVAKPAVAAKPVKQAQPKVKVEAKTKVEDQKVASGLNLELTTDIMAKMAAVVMSTEEGAKAFEYHLHKAAGAQFAEESLNFLLSQVELAEKQAQYDMGAQDAEALMAAEMAAGGDTPVDVAEDTAMVGDDDVTIEEVVEVLEELVSDGTVAPEAAQEILDDLVGGDTAPAGGAAEGPAEVEEEKVARANLVKSELVKAANYKRGYQYAAALIKAAEGTSEGTSAEADIAEDITEEDIAEALADLVEDGTITEEDAAGIIDELESGGGAEDDFTDEEVAEALAYLVEDGTITEEDVVDIINELEG